MTSANIAFAAICWACSLIFGLIALWAFKRKDPMHFWSGSTVRPEEIRDIPAYNRANGIMWAIYTACMFLTGLLSLFGIVLGVVLLVILCVPGVFVLIVAYRRIYNKYKSASEITKKSDSNSNAPKSIKFFNILISIIIFIAIGVLCINSEKDPDVSILDDRIQIKAMYGLDIYFSEVADISLIEKSMNEIGAGRRTNGYGGFGGALKGNFKSDTLGEILLFVQSKSSPTIKIDRIGKKDVYISLSNGDSTIQLYHDLKSNISSE